MRILLVVATELEIESILSFYEDSLCNSSILLQHNTIDILISGVGMVATAYKLGEVLSKNNYDFAINCGIAGAFNKNLNRGDVVIVNDDSIAELGYETGESFFAIEHLGFGFSTFKPNISQDVEWFFQQHLPLVKAISVNTISGNVNTINKRIGNYNPDIESMEGAAFFYACEQAKIPCIQIRSISNYVEERNKENWDIKLAVENLNHLLINFFKSLK